MILRYISILLQFALLLHCSEQELPPPHPHNGNVIEPPPVLLLLQDSAATATATATNILPEHYSIAAIDNEESISILQILKSGKPYYKQIIGDNTMKKRNESNSHTTSTSATTTTTTDTTTATASVSANTLFSGIGYSIQDVSVPASIVWEHILDFNKYNEWIPNVFESTIYHKQQIQEDKEKEQEQENFFDGNNSDDDNYKNNNHRQEQQEEQQKQQQKQRIHVLMTIGYPFYKYQLYIKHLYDPYYNIVTWTLDYDLQSDIYDTVGYWYIVPHPEYPTSMTRIFYGIHISMYRPVPQFIMDTIITQQQALVDATYWIKKYSEESVVMQQQSKSSSNSRSINNNDDHKRNTDNTDESTATSTSTSTSSTTTTTTSEVAPEAIMRSSACNIEPPKRTEELSWNQRLIPMWFHSRGIGSIVGTSIGTTDDSSKNNGFGTITSNDEESNNNDDDEDDDVTVNYEDEKTNNDITEMTKTITESVLMSIININDDKAPPITATDVTTTIDDVDDENVCGVPTTTIEEDQFSSVSLQRIPHIDGDSGGDDHDHDHHHHHHHGSFNSPSSSRIFNSNTSSKTETMHGSLEQKPEHEKIKVEVEQETNGLKRLILIVLIVILSLYNLCLCISP